MKVAIDGMCPLKIHMLKTTPSVMVSGGGAFGRWVGHEDGALMNGISALTRKTPQSCLVPSALWGHSEKTAVYEQRSGSSPDTASADALILDLGLQHCEKYMSDCKPHSLGYSVIAAEVD